VRDQIGRVFATAGSVDPNALPRPDSLDMLTAATMNVVLPLSIGKEQVGELRYGLSLSSILLARSTVLWQGTGIATLEVVLALVILALVWMWLTRNLQKLALTTQAIAKGDYSGQISVKGEDEIAMLARDFNAMSAAVRQRDYEISAMNRDLARRVQERTAELELANKELEAFSYSVSHDLRAPLRTVDGFSQVLLEDYGEKLDQTACDYLVRVRRAAQHMGALIDDMLKLARVTRAPLNSAELDLSSMGNNVIKRLQQDAPERKVKTEIADGMRCHADPGLMQVVLDNLLGNAWKYTLRTAAAQISFGYEEREGQTVYFVRDNGAGFDMRYAAKLFGAFQRLHTPEEFEGTGIGLATVQRIVKRHFGKIWAEAEVGKGAAFFFTIGEPNAASANR
jgi:signal transduction histidine kinase